MHPERKRLVVRAGLVKNTTSAALGNVDRGSLSRNGCDTPRAMTTSAVADVKNSTVTLGEVAFRIQALGDDQYTVLKEGVPVGRLVYTFGAANGVPEGDSVSEDDLYLVAEAWFAALETA
jgi:hypothetical protein